MNNLEGRIEKFIRKNRALTMATTEKGIPHCATMFYVFEKEKGLLYFMSSANSKHTRQGMKFSPVAGTILPDELSLAKIQGIQFTGRFYEPKGDELKAGKKLYMKKYPIAYLMENKLYCIELETIKFTDNTLGFGKKLYWSRNSVNASEMI